MYCESEIITAIIIIRACIRVVLSDESLHVKPIDFIVTIITYIANE